MSVLIIAAGVILGLILLPVVLWLVGNGIVILVMILGSPFMAIAWLGQYMEKQNDRQETWSMAFVRVGATVVVYGVCLAMLLACMFGAMMCAKWLLALARGWRS